MVVGYDGRGKRLVRKATARTKAEATRKLRALLRDNDATLFGCFLNDCPAYSWSTGTSSLVSSHYSRIRAAQPG